MASWACSSTLGPARGNREEHASHQPYLLWGYEHRRYMIFSLKPADRRRQDHYSLVRAWLVSLNACMLICMVWSVGCRGSAPNFGTHDVQLCMHCIHLSWTRWLLATSHWAVDTFSFCTIEFIDGSMTYISSLVECTSIDLLICRPLA